MIRVKMIESNGIAGYLRYFTLQWYNRAKVPGGPMPTAKKSDSLLAPLRVHLGAPPLLYAQRKCQVLYATEER